MSHERATDLAVASDGTVYTAHARIPRAAAPGVHARGGGVRAFTPAATLAHVWFAEDGLVSDDISAIACSDTRVAVVASGQLAVLRRGSSAFALETDAEPRRRTTVIDPRGGGTVRTVTEFRPRDEKILALALEGDVAYLGTDRAILRRAPGEGGAVLHSRFEMPCDQQGLAPVASVLALAPPLLVAVLGVPDEVGGLRPAGLLDMTTDGSRHRCHVPDLDVPASQSLDVATDGERIVMATYEGVVRIRGSEVELVEHATGMPMEAPVAIALDPAVRGRVWVGTWGGGVYRLDEDGSGEAFRFEDAGGLAGNPGGGRVRRATFTSRDAVPTPAPEASRADR